MEEYKAHIAIKYLGFESSIRTLGLRENEQIRLFGFTGVPDGKLFTVRKEDTNRSKNRKPNTNDGEAEVEIKVKEPLVTQEVCRFCDAPPDEKCTCEY